MEGFFEQHLGIPPQLFQYVILPLLIFCARILDVSINTVRIIFVMSGRKLISTLLGFFESLIWLLAIGQIFQHMDNVYSYIAYPLGFAMGIWVGMLIEERLALGKVVVRIIDNQPFDTLVDYLKGNQQRYAIVAAESNEGPKNILFTVVKRDELKALLDWTARELPNSFYTVESVKKASEAGLLPEESRKRSVGSWIGSVKRK